MLPSSWPPPLASSPFSSRIEVVCLRSLTPSHWPRGRFPAHTFCPHSSVLDRRVPASGLVPRAPRPAWPCCLRGLPPCPPLYVLVVGEPTLLPASCVASAALTCHGSPAFLGHPSVTPRRQGVLNLQGWTPVHAQSPQGLLCDTAVHPAQLQPTACKKKTLYVCFLTRRVRAAMRPWL